MMTQNLDYEAINTLLTKNPEAMQGDERSVHEPDMSSGEGDDEDSGEEGDTEQNDQ